VEEMSGATILDARTPSFTSKTLAAAEINNAEHGPIQE
jgi:hypothetical protein